MKFVGVRYVNGKWWVVTAGANCTLAQGKGHATKEEAEEALKQQEKAYNDFYKTLGR